MAWTQADQVTALDALRRAIAGGWLRVKYEDRDVTYRSLADMLRARDELMLELGLLDRGRRRTLSSYRKGVTP